MRKWLTAGVAVSLASSLMSCSGHSSPQRSAPATTPESASTTTPADTAAAFLQAWQAGDTAAAAGFTDTPGAAKVLDDLQNALGVEKRVFTPQPTTTPADMAVPFTAKLTLKGVGEWTYSSNVPISKAGNHFVVAWSPSIIHPKLTATSELRLGPAGPPSPGARVVLDRNGQVLSASEFPSLSSILSQLGPGASAPAVQPGTPATVVQLFDTATGQATTLPGLVRPLGTPGADGITTTLDAGIQATAERAVAAAAGPAAGLVVLQASTGQIRAIASKNPSDRMATLSLRTPGSTLKVLVAAALLSQGRLSPDSKVPCPASYLDPEAGYSVPNANPADTNLGATLEYDLAKSCNTAFTQVGLERLPLGSVADEAMSAFGITKPWDIGLNQPTTYAKVPVPTRRPERDQQLIGEGDPMASPLAMASVAATVVTGTFNQPILLPQVPGRATARGLTPQVAIGLQRMMKAAVAYGTATSLRGLGSVGAKTGTTSAPADMGWMIAFRGDYALACDVTGVIGNGPDGAAVAGPVIAQALGGLPG